MDSVYVTQWVVVGSFLATRLIEIFYQVKVGGLFGWNHLLGVALGLTHDNLEYMKGVDPENMVGQVWEWAFAAEQGVWWALLGYSYPLLMTDIWTNRADLYSPQYVQSFLWGVIVLGLSIMILNIETRRDGWYFFGAKMISAITLMIHFLSAVVVEDPEGMVGAVVIFICMLAFLYSNDGNRPQERRRFASMVFVVGFSCVATTIFAKQMVPVD